MGKGEEGYFTERRRKKVQEEKGSEGVRKGSKGGI